MNHKNKRVALITGATGFIGGHLVCRLVREGWEVHAVVRPESDMTSFIKTRGVVVHTHDGTTAGLQGIVSAVAPSTVFHLASLFLSEHKSVDIERLISSNILFATQLAESMAQAGVWQLINTGTSWQHFEGDIYCPVNLYASTKQAFEAILRYYVESTPLRAVTLKLYDTYGPDDQRQKLFYLLRQVAKQQKPLVMSPGEQLIDLVHIDDVLDAYIIAADTLHQEKIAGHEVFSVSSGAPIKLEELVSIYARLLGQELPIQWGGRPYRNREVMKPWDAGTLLNGWSPRISLEDGLRQLIAETTKRLMEMA